MNFTFLIIWDYSARSYDLIQIWEFLLQARLIHIEMVGRDFFDPSSSGKVGKIDLTRWYLELLEDERSYQKAPAPRYQKS